MQPGHGLLHAVLPWGKDRRHGHQPAGNNERCRNTTSCLIAVHGCSLAITNDLTRRKLTETWTLVEKRPESETID